MDAHDISLFTENGSHFMGFHIHDLLDLQIHEEEQKGSIMFDGYCYYQFPNETNEDNDYTKELPQHLLLYVRKPGKEEVHSIQFIHRECLEDTSAYMEDEEFGGSICFFPTMKQVILFKILQKIDL